MPNPILEAMRLKYFTRRYLLRSKALRKFNRQAWARYQKAITKRQEPISQ